jgi:hypothetical protein
VAAALRGGGEDGVPVQGDAITINSVTEKVRRLEEINDVDEVWDSCSYTMYGIHGNDNF